MGNGTRRIGAHVSSSGGYNEALERIAAIGGNCMQIFTGSPRMWKRSGIPASTAEISRERVRRDITPLFIHASYLLNPVSENSELIEKSRESLLYDLRFNAEAAGSGVIFHPGSNRMTDRDTVLSNLVAFLSDVLQDSPADSKIILENAAGQTGKVAGDLSEIRYVLDSLSDDRIAWCFDTCHGFASGYRLDPDSTRTGKNYKAGIIRDIERYKLRDTLVCIHVNDSRDPFGSGRDRHENIGMGFISKKSLAEFLNHPLVQGIPLILEVPGIKGEGPDAENIMALRKILEHKEPDE